jgi:hypothetical protein
MVTLPDSTTLTLTTTVSGLGSSKKLAGLLVSVEALSRTYKAGAESKELQEPEAASVETLTVWTWSMISD